MPVNREFPLKSALLETGSIQTGATTIQSAKFGKFPPASKEWPSFRVLPQVGRAKVSKPQYFASLSARFGHPSLNEFCVVGFRKIPKDQFRPIE
jgi:hypothetical protein